MKNVGNEGGWGTWGGHLGKGQLRARSRGRQWLRPLFSAVVVVVQSRPTLLRPQGVQIAFPEIYQHTSYLMEIWHPDFYFVEQPAAATAAKSLQSCLTLCNPIDSSPPGSPVPGILQARTLEWVAISFSSAWNEKWKWSFSVRSNS